MYLNWICNICLCQKQLDTIDERVNTGPAGSVVEHPLRDREVVGSNPGRAIPKALKMVPVATLLGAQHYKASTGFSSPNTFPTTNFATLAKK